MFIFIFGVFLLLSPLGGLGFASAEEASPLSSEDSTSKSSKNSWLVGVGTVTVGAVALLGWSATKLAQAYERTKLEFWKLLVSVRKRRMEYLLKNYQDLLVGDESLVLYFALLDCWGPWQKNAGLDLLEKKLSSQQLSIFSERLNARAAQLRKKPPSFPQAPFELFKRFFQKPFSEQKLAEMSPEELTLWAQFLQLSATGRV